MAKHIRWDPNLVTILDEISAYLTLRDGEVKYSKFQDYRRAAYYVNDEIERILEESKNEETK